MLRNVGVNNTEKAEWAPFVRKTVSLPLNMSSSSLFEQYLSALKRNDEKSLLLLYDDLSSTISSRTRSTSDLKSLVNEGHLHRTFGAETYIPLYARNDQNKVAGLHLLSSNC